MYTNVWLFAVEIILMYAENTVKDIKILFIEIFVCRERLFAYIVMWVRKKVLQTSCLV